MKNKCNCKEISCVKGCEKNHTCHTYDCEACSASAIDITIMTNQQTSEACPDCGHINGNHLDKCPRVDMFKSTPQPPCEWDREFDKEFDNVMVDIHLDHLRFEGDITPREQIKSFLRQKINQERDKAVKEREEELIEEIKPSEEWKHCMKIAYGEDEICMMCGFSPNRIINLIKTSPTRATLGK